jgi:hypothetical protein
MGARGIPAIKKKRARGVSREPGEVDAPWGDQAKMAPHPWVSGSEAAKRTAAGAADP